DNPDDLKRLVSSLREELSASKKEIARKAQQLNKKQTHIDVLEEKLRALQRQRFGTQSEKTSGQHQLHFFNEAELLAAEQPEDAEVETVDIPAHQRKKKSTRGLDPNLPRVEVVYDLDEAEKHCACGKVLAWIADEVLEQLAVIPLQYYVIRHVRKKYACDGGQCIKTAKKKPQPIEKSQASAQLLAHIMVSKYLDGLPLYRQEKILQRHDQSLSGGKMARWLIKSAECFQPLYNLFEDALFSYDITLSDETGIQVLKEHNRAAESHSYLWIRRGGPPDKPVVLVDYSPSRSGETAYGLLNQCHGYLVADAYAGYNKSIARNGLKLVACNDHARRRFVEVIKNAKKLHKAKSKLQIAEQAVAYYAKLYAIEAQVKALTVEQRYRVRQEKSVPLWRRFRAWLEKTHAEGVAHSGTRNAIGYMLSHW
ncbi:MAG: IS66 family transposase, partial [Candidatus Omnitrophica bacterium]|nr:IS66 family transposase [Candidatus Omnitrophota bacterium]